MLTRVVRWEAGRDGPLSEASLQRKIESLGFVVVARTYPAGVAADPTSDPRESLTAVLGGPVTLTIAGEVETLTDGDLAIIPGGIPRRLELAGSSPALCLEAYRPARRP